VQAAERAWNSIKNYANTNGGSDADDGKALEKKRYVRKEWQRVCVCVCVCVRQRERDRKFVSEQVKERNR